MSTVTIEKEMFLHIQKDGTRCLHEGDMGKHSRYFGVSVGKVVCTITYEDIPNVDPRSVLIGKLEDEITEKRSECQREVNRLLDQISKLQCLEYQPEAQS